MFSFAQSLFLTLFTFPQPSYGDYYIDDTNSTLTYSSDPKVSWMVFNASNTIQVMLLPDDTYMQVDAFACYNHT